MAVLEGKVWKCFPVGCWKTNQDTRHWSGVHWIWTTSFKKFSMSRKYWWVCLLFTWCTYKQQRCTIKVSFYYLASVIPWSGRPLVKIISRIFVYKGRMCPVSSKTARYTLVETYCYFWSSRVYARGFLLVNQLEICHNYSKYAVIDWCTYMYLAILLVWLVTLYRIFLFSKLRSCFNWRISVDCSHDSLYNVPNFIVYGWYRGKFTAIFSVFDDNMIIDSMLMR